MPHHLTSFSNFTNEHSATEEVKTRSCKGMELLKNMIGAPSAYIIIHHCVLLCLEVLSILDTISQRNCNNTAQRENAGANVNLNKTCSLPHRIQANLMQNKIYCRLYIYLDILFITHFLHLSMAHVRSILFFGLLNIASEGGVTY